MKYEQEYENENGWSDWVFPNRKDYRFSCCDCGLVHKMQFKMDGKHILFKVKKDNRATGQIRRLK